jgi:hypothetical protein
MPTFAITQVPVTTPSKSDDDIVQDLEKFLDELATECPPAPAMPLYANIPVSTSDVGTQTDDSSFNIQPPTPMDVATQTEDPPSNIQPSAPMDVPTQTEDPPSNIQPSESSDVARRPSRLRSYVLDSEDESSDDDSEDITIQQPQAPELPPRDPPTNTTVTKWTASNKDITKIFDFYPVDGQYPVTSPYLLAAKDNIPLLKQQVLDHGYKINHANAQEIITRFYNSGSNNPDGIKARAQRKINKHPPNVYFCEVTRARNKRQRKENSNKKTNKKFKSSPVISDDVPLF